MKCLGLILFWTNMASKSTRNTLINLLNATKTEMTSGHFVTVWPDASVRLPLLTIPLLSSIILAYYDKLWTFALLGRVIVST